MYPRTEKDRQERNDRRHILQIPMNEDMRSCGLDGPDAYEHRPRTAFQATCRQQNARNLQHITSCHRGHTAERVCNIPLIAGSSDKGGRNG